MVEEQVVEIYSAADAQEAWLIHGELVNAGVEARVVGDHLQNAVGDLPAVSIAPRIWVNASQVAAARELIVRLLEDLRESKIHPGQTWSCAQCRETNEPNFAICWNCQSQRGAEAHCAD
jgi:hypothetical protein